MTTSFFLRNFDCSYSTQGALKSCKQGSPTFCHCTGTHSPRTNSSRTNFHALSLSIMLDVVPKSQRWVICHCGDHIHSYSRFSFILLHKMSLLDLCALVPPHAVPGAYISRTFSQFGCSTGVGDRDAPPYTTPSISLVRLHVGMDIRL